MRMDLETVQAALAEVERELKSIGNKIKYRNDVIQRESEILAMHHRKRDDLIDRYEKLVVRERELKGEA